MLVRYPAMSAALHGRTCTIVLVGLAPSRDRGVTYRGGMIDVADGVARLLSRAGGEPVHVPPHLLEGIEEVTDDLCAGLEIDLDTQLCLRVYYRGRRRLKTLGWNAVLEQSSSASTVE